MAEELFKAEPRKHTSAEFCARLKDGKALARKLEKLNDKGRVALKSTVSDFASRGPGWIKKGIKEHYGVDEAAIKESKPWVKRGGARVAAGGTYVDGVQLIYRGRTLTPTHFKQRPQHPAGRTKEYVRLPGTILPEAKGAYAMVHLPKKQKITAEVIKGSRKALPSDAFITTGRGDKALPYQRQGGPRSRSIEAVRTLSVPQMISGKSKAAVDEMIAKNMEERLEHHVERVMKL